MDKKNTFDLEGLMAQVSKKDIYSEKNNDKIDLEYLLKIGEEKQKNKKRSYGYYLSNYIDDKLIELAKLTGLNKSEVLEEILKKTLFK